MRILIASGGSGGHIFPAVALKRALAAKAGCSIKFIGADKAIDRRIFEKECVDFSLLSANKLPYRVSPSMILFFIKFFYDVLRALWITAAYRPSCCVGFGGYVSFPVVLSGRLLGVRTVVHEQNVVPGRANRILFRFADKIALSFEDTLKYLKEDDRKKAVVTGNPIRTEDFRDDRSAAAKSFGLDASKFTVLVVGGSQGAHVLNDSFARSLSGMDSSTRAGIQVIHLTGTKDYDWALKEYARIDGVQARVYSFIDRIEEAYSASDLIVTRAGASALFEAAYFGKAMIVVPYPYAMSHQAENAKAFSCRGAALKVDEKDLSEDFFRNAIGGFLKDRPGLSKMGEMARALSAPDASARLAGIVIGGVK